MKSSFSLLFFQNIISKNYNVVHVRIISKIYFVIYIPIIILFVNEILIENMIEKFENFIENISI